MLAWGDLGWVMFALLWLGSGLTIFHGAAPLACTSVVATLIAIHLRWDQARLQYYGTPCQDPFRGCASPSGSPLKHVSGTCD